MEKSRTETDLVLKRGLVTILTLNRPDKLNALSNDLLTDMVAELDRSAGADIHGFQKHIEAGPAEAVAYFMMPGHQLTRRIESYPKLV
jgi:enoyl-CoA hydratase